jgi:gamma-glutamyltranspeptidase/glutathione hydrolase
LCSILAQLRFGYLCAMKRAASPLVAVAVALACACAEPLARTPTPTPPAAPAPRPVVSAPLLDGGAVASPEPLASEVGARVLRRGGNAVDAAIAVGFALAVTFPTAGNLGGGGFMLVHREGHEDVALDYRETAPTAAHRDMFLDEKGKVIDGLSLTSHKAAGTPGSVAGLWLAHQRFGSVPWKELVAPAIELARAPAAHDPKVPLPDQHDLARTLERIAEHGPDGFYRGETARLIAEEMRRGGGLITEADLAAYQAKIRVPVAGTYRGHRVVSMPPPSSGGVILVQMLHMLEGFDPKKLGHNSTGGMHLIAEIEKRAFADRSVWLGDSDFFDVPVDVLTSKAYAKKRAETVNLTRRTDPGTIQEGLAREKPQTTHYSVVDRFGNAVSCTTTLNDAHGSGLIVKGAGFLLNNEMDDFSLKPGVPNMYGVIGGDANAIAPGKRMLSSMSPTFVYRPDGALWLVLGSPGGPTIFTTVFQVIVNRLDHGMTLADAVAAPRFHHQWPPRKDLGDLVLAEQGVDTRGLVELGYKIRTTRLGDVHAVEIDRAARRATGASDPRGRGRAVPE